MKQTRRHISITIMIVAIAVITGCAKSVEITTDFPAPVIEPYPLVAGIRYPAELTDFTHVENPELQPEWTIKLGAANIQMFRILFSSMFNKVIELDAESEVETYPEIDFIIEPKLEEVEFSVPKQSGTDQYVVWLRYNLKMLQPDGQLLGNWRITGYGQQDQGDLGLGSENAMKGAAIAALRDTAASIIVGFNKAPGIRKYILAPEASPENNLPSIDGTTEPPENSNTETDESAENQI